MGTNNSCWEWILISICQQPQTTAVWRLRERLQMCCGQKISRITKQFSADQRFNRPFLLAALLDSTREGGQLQTRVLSIKRGITTYRSTHVCWQVLWSYERLNLRFGGKSELANCLRTQPSLHDLPCSWNTVIFKCQLWKKMQNKWKCDVR